MLDEITDFLPLFLGYLVVGVSYAFLFDCTFAPLHQRLSLARLGRCCRTPHLVTDPEFVKGSVALLEPVLTFLVHSHNSYYFIYLCLFCYFCLRSFFPHGLQLCSHSIPLLLMPALPCSQQSDGNFHSLLLKTLFPPRWFSSILLQFYFLYGASRVGLRSCLTCYLHTHLVTCGSQLTGRRMQSS